MVPTEVCILLIEDDPDDAALFEALLKDTGRPATVVREGLLALALRRLRDREFDLVFLDLSLPDSWGINTLRRLHRAFPDTPVVLMTGATIDSELATTAAREGATACLMKHELTADSLAGILADLANR